MKDYAPNICLPLKITWKQDAKVEKGGLIQSKIDGNLPKVKSGHLHIRHNMCVKYHDPSSSGSPDILFTISIGLQCVSQKRGIIQSNIHKLL